MFPTSANTPYAVHLSTRSLRLLAQGSPKLLVRLGGCAPAFAKASAGKPRKLYRHAACATSHMVARYMKCLPTKLN